MCIIIYPLDTSHCPLNHLAFRWLVSQQKKWKIRRKEDRNVFISVCSTTEVNFCEFPVNAIRESSTTNIVIIAIFPEDPSKCQIFRAAVVSFINTVFPCNECKIPFRRWLHWTGRRIKHKGGSRIFQEGGRYLGFAEWIGRPPKMLRFENWNPIENNNSYGAIVLVREVLKITVVGDWRSTTWTEVPNVKSFQNYPHPDVNTIRTIDTPGFKPFTVLIENCYTRNTSKSTK